MVIFRAGAADAATKDHVSVNVLGAASNLVATFSMLRAAAEKCDVLSEVTESDSVVKVSFPATTTPLTTIPPERFSRAAECIDMLHLAAKKGEAAGARRQECANKLREAELKTLMPVALWLGHDEMILVLQEKTAALLENLETPEEIRTLLNITGTLNEEEEAAAATAPLLSSDPNHTADDADADAMDPDVIEAFLGRCSGATLRKMLRVSRVWAQHARDVAARADWLEAVVVSVASGESAAEIGWALAHGLDLQELLRRLPSTVTRLRAGGDEAELETLLSASVLDREKLIQATGGDDVEARRPLQHAAALYAVMRSQNLTTIGWDAFRDCSTLVSVSLPAGVTSIGRNAFRGCSTLTSVTLPEGIASIGSHAFVGCVALTSITLPGSLTTIDEQAFGGCSALDSVILPAHMTSIEQFAFEDCTSLTSITLPRFIATIRPFTFKRCSSLRNVAFPAGLRNIERGAFLSCTSLASIHLPSLIEHIGPQAFEGCTSMKEVTLPSSLTRVNSGVFRDCSSLRKVVLPAGLRKIEGDAFSGCSSLNVPKVPAGTVVAEDAFKDCQPDPFARMAGFFQKLSGA